MLALRARVSQVVVADAGWVFQEWGSLRTGIFLLQFEPQIRSKGLEVLLTSTFSARTIRTPMHTPARFLVVGGIRAWRPMKGHTAPEGKIHELRTIPGNVVACAKTKQAACEKLIRHLEACFDAAGDFDSWYATAWEHTSTADRDVFGREMIRVFQNQLPAMKDADIEIFTADLDEKGCLTNEAS